MLHTLLDSSRMALDGWVNGMEEESEIIGCVRLTRNIS